VAELDVGDDGFHRPGWAKWPGGLGARNAIGPEENEKENRETGWAARRHGLKSSWATEGK
jgi:hypothetical protein